jgi:hypothetical protein
MIEELKTLDPKVTKLAIKAVWTAKGPVASSIRPAIGLDGDFPVGILRTLGGRVMQLLNQTDDNVLTYCPRINV